MLTTTCGLCMAMQKQWGFKTCKDCIGKETGICDEYQLFVNQVYNFYKSRENATKALGMAQKTNQTMG